MISDMKKAKETTIRLFGVIGEEINGNEFARSLSDLDGEHEIVNLHVNSPGGNVDQGYSILSVILSMKATVNVTIVGIAASMAAVIAVCGDNVYMNDYSRLMIHDPTFASRENGKLTGKEKKTLETIKESLCTILSRRGGSMENVSRLMTEETWFTAGEALKAGLVDRIISTRKQEYKKLTTNDIYNRVSLDFINKSKNMDIMKELASLLGLSAPTEEEIIEAVKRLMNKPVESVALKLEKALSSGIIDQVAYDSLLDMGNYSPESLDKYLDKLNGDHEERTRENVERVLKSKNFIREDIKNKLVNLARIDFNLFESITNMITPIQRLSQLINNGGISGRSGWTLDDYRKNDPEALRENPALYNRLVEQYKKNIND